MDSALGRRDERRRPSVVVVVVVLVVVGTLLRAKYGSAGFGAHEGMPTR